MQNRIRAAVIALLAVLTALGGATVATAASEIGCERGELCLWSQVDHSGDLLRATLADATVGQCTPLPPDVAARSFANLLSRQVTVYQSRECATEGEFDTYPGGGTFVPEAPYLVRAFQVW
ncbi:peptidase inhibitor family I36 protein [Actinokineospora sp. PR83]|uniref:peptidase inhibitor family I36 protein n=1 Tax=Actinokineospora sp. PR83 TaxID=2884908 RepID=UPI001F19CA9E|nr:peptidase inhibitor family I36 protein [Actinokineospora sp. PR83]MCG8915618.1 peptidase inhibitor family I36 protein [Actinokineospora sp. PR83]